MPGIKKVRYEKKCDECGDPFVASMKNAKFCSGACKARWNRKNEKLTIKLNAVGDANSSSSGRIAFHELVMAVIIGKDVKELKERYVTGKYEFTRDWMNPGHTEAGYFLKYCSQSQVIGNNDKSTKRPPM